MSLFSLSACATGDFEAEADRVAGIYQVQSHTLNATSCAPGGQELADQHRFAFAVRGELFGQEYLALYSCDSLADCRAKAAQDPFTGVVDFDFTLTEAGSSALFGGGISTGFSEGDRCTSPEAWDTELSLDGSALRIERAIRVGRDYAADRAGYCTTDLAEEATRDASCSRLEVLTATRIEKL